MSSDANSSPELDPADAGPVDFDKYQRRFPRMVLAMRGFSIGCLPLAISMLMTPGGEVTGGLATTTHVLLSANVLACVKFGIPEQQEISHFMGVHRAMAIVCSLTFAVLPDTPDNFLVLVLVASSQIKGAIAAVCDLCQVGSLLWQGQLASWFLDEVSHVALAARLIASGGSMGQPSAVVTMLASCMFARALHEGVVYDNANLRRKLGAALEKSHHANSQLESALALKQGALKALARMLSGVCDCRLNVSDALCITDPSAQFHDMLGGVGSHEHLYGCSLENFLSEQDAERLRRSMSRDVHDEEGGGSGPASCLQVGLLNVSAERVPVELYHVRISSSEHAVAFRRQKQADVEPAPMAAEEHQPAEDDEPSADDRCWIDLDAAHPSLRVCGESEEFQGLCAKRAGLLDFVRSSRRSRVAHWVNETYEAVARAEEDEAVHASKVLFFELQLDLATVVARKTWLECFPCEPGRGGAQKPVRLWLEGLIVNWKAVVAEDAPEEATVAGERCETVSEVDVGDSFSQIGHLFFISNK